MGHPTIAVKGVIPMSNIARTALVVLLLPLAVVSQTGDDQPLMAEKQKRVQAWKEKLKKIKDGRNLADFEGIQIALAKEGESEQLQQIICELDFGLSDVQENALRKMRSVGGWFSINALSRFLTSDPRYMQTRPDDSPDQIFIPLQFRALQILPLIVPNPPLPEAQGFYQLDHSKEVEIWRKWLHENRASLENLEPLASGVVSSVKVCKKVLRNDPALRRQK